VTIEAVIFDFGGVFTASPFTGIHAWHVEKGLDPAQGLRIVFGPYDQDTDHPWHRLERGEIALMAAAEQIKAVAAEEGLDIELSEMFGSMGGSSIRADMVEKAIEIRKAGYRTALITNNIKEFSDGWRAMIPVASPTSASTSSPSTSSASPPRGRCSSTTRPATSPPPARWACTGSSWRTTTLAP
jgi:putative hydrolase of the HAD superfamily